jgi:hypothetical protein
MPTTELTTAKYFNDPQPPQQPGLTDTPEPAASQPSSAGILAAANSYLTLVVAAGFLICVTIVAFPDLKSAWSERPKNVLDLWLRFGGAKPDQTFEKFIIERTEADQRQWAEMYKNSPAYQLKDIPTFNLDSKQFNWQLNQPQRRK